MPNYRALELVSMLSQAAQNGGPLTEAEALEINRMFEELAQQGVAALPAIRDLLRRMEDVNFDALSGGEMVAYGTLRLALLDVLSRIGGSEATRVALEQLRLTTDPAEIALLALSLELDEPRMYREEILDAARAALQWARQVPRGQRSDVSPLFELLQAYGDPDVVGDLERDMEMWWEYSLMALASLPEGSGVPSLIAQAANPYVPVQYRLPLPFQMLAQASAQYAEAGNALVDLARSREIPDRAWEAIGDALQGKHLIFPFQLFDGASRSGVESPLTRSYYIEYLNMRFEQRLASTSWSADRIDQQLMLIDDLLDVATGPAAQRALREARASLQGGRY